MSVMTLSSRQQGALKMEHPSRALLALMVCIREETCTRYLTICWGKHVEEQLHELYSQNKSTLLQL